MAWVGLDQASVSLPISPSWSTLAWPPGQEETWGLVFSTNEDRPRLLGRSLGPLTFTFDGGLKDYAQGMVVGDDVVSAVLGLTFTSRLECSHVNCWPGSMDYGKREAGDVRLGICGPPGGGR